MSSGSFKLNVAVQTQGDDVGSSGYSMQINGSVYRAAPGAVSEGETQSFRITDIGELYVVSSAPDAEDSPYTANPQGVAGIYRASLPTYDDGDVARFHMDVNGQLLVSDADVVSALGSPAQESTLQSVDASTTAIAGDTATLAAVDFATETTLASVASDIADILDDTASLDTKTPALGQAAMAASVPVAIASDQGAIETESHGNGGDQVTTVIDNTADTITAPAGAIGFILQADSENSDNLRWAIGDSASTTIGNKLEPGRDTGYVPCGANISICAESGSQEYQIQWITRT